MNTSKDNKWRNGKALERYTLIAPLLEGSLDPAKRLQMREDIASRNGISLRSLYRYEAAFKKEVFFRTETGRASETAFRKAAG